MLKRLFKETTTYAIAETISARDWNCSDSIYTRMLSPDEFGLYDILLTIWAFSYCSSGLQVESGIDAVL